MAHPDGVLPTPALRSLCRDIKGKIEAFLAEDIETGVLRRVQEQTRLSLQVAGEALQRYECAASSSAECFHGHVRTDLGPDFPPYLYLTMEARTAWSFSYST